MRIEDALLPLTQNLHPGEKMKFEIVAGRVSPEEKREDDSKGSGGNHKRGKREE